MVDQHCQGCSRLQRRTISLIGVLHPCTSAMLLQKLHLVPRGCGCCPKHDAHYGCVSHMGQCMEGQAWRGCGRQKVHHCLGLSRHALAGQNLALYVQTCTVSLPIRTMPAAA